MLLFSIGNGIGSVGASGSTGIAGSMVIIGCIDVGVNNVRFVVCIPAFAYKLSLNGYDVAGSLRSIAGSTGPLRLVISYRTT